nr:p25 protein [Soybean yellow mottle mosaic virus]
MLIQFGTMPPVRVEGPPRAFSMRMALRSLGSFLANCCANFGDAWADSVTRNRTQHVQALEYFGDFPIKKMVTCTGGMELEPNNATREVAHEKRVVNRHAKGYFLSEMVASCRLHFNGIPRSTEANLLGVRRFLANYCQEHRLTNQQTLRLVNAAAPLVMTANQDDVASMKLMNDPLLNYYRALYLEAQVVHTPLRQLVARPLSKECWQQWFDSVRGFRDPSGFRLVQ